jgi:hypothetical protein
VQVADLHKTINNLNACFLDFTDHLLASGWLDRDPKVTRSLQSTIEHFITIVRTSHAHDEFTSGKEDSRSSATIVPALEDGQDSAALSWNNYTALTSNTGMKLNTITIEDLDGAPSRQQPTAAFGLEEKVAESVQNDEIPGPASLEVFSYRSIPGYNDTLNYMPQVPIPADLFKPTFAQKLHIEAIRAGLRLVCTAEDRSQLFFRVFRRVLDFSTRENYRAHLNRVLNENFGQLLLPPPESNPEDLWPGGYSSLWLNASDVASQFRSIGMDFDSSLDIVNVEAKPKFLPDIWPDMEPGAGFTPFSVGRFSTARHQQRPNNRIGFHGPAYQGHGIATSQVVDESGLHGTGLADTTGSHGGSFMSVSVSRLIHGE